MHAPLTGPYARTERRAIALAAGLMLLGKVAQHGEQLAATMQAGPLIVAGAASVAASGIFGVLHRRRQDQASQREVEREVEASIRKELAAQVHRSEIELSQARAELRTWCSGSGACLRAAGPIGAADPPGLCRSCQRDLDASRGDGEG